MILSSRTKLTPGSAVNYPSESLFDRLARVLCAADCLPRKELYESWEVARRVRKRFRGGRVVDLACGHGLVAWILLILDDTSKEALAVDRRFPESATLVEDAIAEAWPRVAGRVKWTKAHIEDEALTLSETDLVVSAHACGALTDRILARAAKARARVAVLPCCHSATTCDTGGLMGWMDESLAIDATRAQRLASAGYDVRTQTIPSEITPKNRLLLGEPRRPE